MESIHKKGDCYINCSHSEGVGMGAVEAAVRNKPVIISDFGGLSEYVQTPFVVPCAVGPCGISDFLFQPHMHWGFPDPLKLKEHMKCAFNDLSF